MSPNHSGMAAHQPASPAFFPIRFRMPRAKLFRFARSDVGDDGIRKGLNAIALQVEHRATFTSAAPISP
jgi:hypothetical protein